MVDLKVINTRIKKIGNGENTFRSEMGNVSRELLSYVPETGDIDAVNRLMAVLTPSNREKAKQYFTAFLAHKFDKNEGRFGKKSTNKDAVAKKRKLVTEFLSNEDNNIWTWAAAKAQPVERVEKPKNYEKQIEHLVERSLTDEKEAIDIKAMLRAIIRGGATLTDIFAALDAVAKETEIVKAADVKDSVKPEAANDVKPQENVAPRRKAA